MGYPVFDPILNMFRTVGDRFVKTVVSTLVFYTCVCVFFSRQSRETLFFRPSPIVIKTRICARKSIKNGPRRRREFGTVRGDNNTSEWSSVSRARASPVTCVFRFRLVVVGSATSSFPPANATLLSLRRHGITPNKRCCYCYISTLVRRENNVMPVTTGHAVPPPMHGRRSVENFSPSAFIRQSSTKLC